MNFIRINFLLICCFTAIIFMQVSCTKSFLDVKRDKSQVIPETLEDYQGILDNDKMNYNSSYLLGEIGSDDYFISNDQWLTLSSPVQKNGYIWGDDIYIGEKGEDWNRGYEKILFANFVLEGVSVITETEENKVLRDEILGAAHFYRGKTLFLLSQLFCKQYDSTTAHLDLGLPLRVLSNVNVHYSRATLEETYHQILYDLEMAALLLPNTSYVNTRPTKAAALGVLARVYLQTGEYDLALKNVDRALSLAHELIDYNSIDVDASTPFPLYGQGNSEVIFYSQMSNAAVHASSRLTIDSILYSSYHENDLRKKILFRRELDRVTFKGHYSGISAFMFTGLTTPELILIRAECNARLGFLMNAVLELNKLLSKRLRLNTFIGVSNDLTQGDLLDLIISERRKELVYRGRRWHDLKRLNKEPRYAQPLKRVLGEDEYILPINSPKWVWPIPPEVINLGGIEQNER